MDVNFGYSVIKRVIVVTVNTTVIVVDARQYKIVPLAL